MKTVKRINVLIVPALILIIFMAFSGFADDWGNNSRKHHGKKRSFCERTARDMLNSCTKEVQSDYWQAVAIAENLPTDEERREAKREAREDFRESFSECLDQFDARLELCEELEEDFYHPEIDPADFVEVIDNPFMPLIPGVTRVYEGDTEDGFERVVVEVTDNTVEILGVACVEVRDTAFLDDEVIEDTRDWFAQDMEGNVWYFGEISIEFEDGEIASLAGSWKAGVDGAKPGIVMFADPEVGEVYRQEYAIGEAEDAAEVLSLEGFASVPYDDFNDCLVTGDFTPIEPDTEEEKYYAAGVGVVLEVDLESGERIELVEINVD